MAKRPVIAFLSTDPESLGNVRFEEEGRELGLDVRILDPVHFDLVVHSEEPKTFYCNERFDPPAAFIPRTGTSTDFGRAVVRHMQDTPGVVVINTIEAVSRCRDKLLTHQLLAEAGIPFPKTVLSRRGSDVTHMVHEVGGPPVVLKLISGSHGKGVMLGRDADEIQAALETVWALNETLLIQEFVKESAGRDIRVLVVGGKVLGAVERSAELGRFRANVHQGGSVRPFPLDEQLEWLAVRTTEAIGLDIAGVDVLHGPHGYLVIEANSAPGFEGFERATGMNVAAEILRYAQFRIGG